MTQKRDTSVIEIAKEASSGPEDWLCPLVQDVVQQVLEGEMSEQLGAGKYQCKDGRGGYRSGYYRRKLTTRVGTIELRVPQDRDGRFSTEVFERYQRHEREKRRWPRWRRCASRACRRARSRR